MAFYRRRYSRYSRRRFTSRTRYRRNYTRKTRFKKSVYNKPTLVKRLGLPATGSTSNAPTISQILNNGSTHELVFKLESVTSYHDLVSLYNEFKLRAVKISFIPLVNMTSMAQSSFAHVMYSAIDINGQQDSTPDQIKQYQSVKWSPYNRIHSRYFYPRTTIDNKVIPGKQPWLSTQSYNRKYYSLLIAPPTLPGVPTTDPIYRIECTYYLSFRSPN